MRRLLCIWLSALCIGTAVVACDGGSSTKRATPTAPAEPSVTIEIQKGKQLKIGVSAALSGEQQALGADLADAVALAAKDHGAIKGRAAVVLRMDDRCSDAEKAVAVAHSLAGDAAVVGVVGPMCTTGAQAAGSVYEAARVVHIVPSATRADLSEQGERYFFRTTWLDDAQARVQATYAREQLHATTVVLVDDAEPYGKTLADAFATAFQAAGGTIASRERIERGTTDFSALARKVKSANPDIAVFEGLNPEGALVVQALRKGDYQGAFMAPDGVMNARDFIAADKTGATDGTIVTGGPTPDDTFVAKFRDAYQRAPSTPFVLQAYDAATALLRAIDTVATEGTDGTLVIDRAQLAGAMRANSLTGLTGTIRFDEHGNRSGDAARDAGLVIYRVASGKFVAEP
jgi:branched-chain amino acid transport system substrate-binding protein